jgi:hypothetical protein
MSTPAKVRCPICGKMAPFFSEPVGPFCSARCQMIDLGKWLGEEYRISEPLPPTDPSLSDHENERGPLDEGER